MNQSMASPSLKTFHSVIITNEAFCLFCYAMTDELKFFIFDACFDLQVNAVNMYKNNSKQ